MQVHRSSTAVQVEAHLRRHILPTFGDRPIASIRPSEIQAWVRERQGKLQAATIEVAYRYLAAIFRMAVRDRMIVRTPCVEVKLPRVERRRVTPLRTEEVAAVVAAVPERYRALIIVGAGAGLRQGEAFGLTVPHVDFLRARLHVEQQLVLLPKRPMFLAPPKTESSDRKIPLGDVVVRALARHLELFPPTCALEAVSGRQEPLVFSTDRGQPISRTTFSAQVWRPAVKVAGLTGKVTYHDLRHYYASLLIGRGASVKVVQARLGHKSATETLDTYSHLGPDDEDLTRNATDAELAALADGKTTGKIMVGE